MKKKPVILLALGGLLLCGCAGGDAPGTVSTEEAGENLAAGGQEEESKDREVVRSGREEEGEAGRNGGEEGMEAGTEKSEEEGENGGGETRAEKEVIQEGPYGQLSLSIPEGWSYVTYSIDSEESFDNRYGIRFQPEDAADGYVELVYAGWFGVCGTGLDNESSFLAGNPVDIGTYDGHSYWDFIRFQGDMDGVVALTDSVEDWWESYRDQVAEILDTAGYDPDSREGGAWIYEEGSEAEEIGLYLSLKKISPTGATLVFRQYDKEASRGELQFGEDYGIEVYRDGKWEDVPVAAEGNYAFKAIAYVINPEETTEKELDWEWLYGALAPGEYRIRKKVDDFREAGDYDTYTVYARFILN